MTPPSSHRPHVLVLGGGFAGLQVCKRLAPLECDVTLLDRTNHHLFQPLLYQVATASVAPGDVASPLRALLREHPNIRVRREEVTSVDLEKRVVVTSDSTHSYDYLVVATGTRSTYYGRDEWSEVTLPLKSLQDAIEVRRQVLDSLEEAEMAGSDSSREQLSTLVVIGGGPTGVEMAGALVELLRDGLRNEFRSFDPSSGRVVLVEAAERLLSTHHPKQSAYVQQRLERMGVEVLTETKVEEIGDGFLVAGGVRYNAATIVWAAGMEALPLTRTLGVPTDRAGRILVEPDLSLPDRPEVFAIGDTVRLVDAASRLVPGVAPAAMQMGNHVADTLREEIRADHDAGYQPRDRKPFVYFDKGDLATVGRFSAVADFRGFKVRGILAWFLWLGVHLLFLVGFKNRVSVFIGWVYSYLMRRNHSRVIVTESSSAKPAHEPLVRPLPQPVQTP